MNMTHLNTPSPATMTVWGFTCSMGEIITYVVAGKRCFTQNRSKIWIEVSSETTEAQFQDMGYVNITSIPEGQSAIASLIHERPKLSSLTHQMKKDYADEQRAMELLPKAAEVLFSNKSTDPYENITSVAIDDILSPGECHCEHTPDPDDPDENTKDTSLHYLRRCQFCKATWWGLHCPHDGFQNPCGNCGKTPLKIDKGVPSVEANQAGGGGFASVSITTPPAQTKDVTK